MRRAVIRRTAVTLAIVSVCLIGGAVSPARADSGAPGDTTSTPTPTVTAPDAAPTASTPAPDPGPVNVAPKPKPHVVPHTAPAAPAVVQPSQPAATPKHITAPRRHHVKRKHQTTSRPSAKTLVIAKPKRTAVKATLPAILPAKISPTGGTGGGWVDTAIGVGLAVLFVSAMFVATRRALRVPSGVAAGSAAVVLPRNGSHNGRHEAELSTLETLGFASMEDAPALPAGPARCTIRCWHGYVRSQFVAFEQSEAGRTIIAESPPFRWRSSKPPPQTAETFVAHRELLAALTNLGWEAVESGPAWFDLELERVGTPISI